MQWTKQNEQTVYSNRWFIVNLADVELPDHPLVKQTMEDCLREAMDVDGLREVLRRIKDGRIRRAYIGVAGQNAANARAHEPGTARTDVLAAVSDMWAGLDPAEYPFTRAVAGQLREHDDREQFLAGVDLILAGITHRRPA